MRALASTRLLLDAPLVTLLFLRRLLLVDLLGGLTKWLRVRGTFQLVTQHLFVVLYRILLRLLLVYLLRKIHSQEVLDALVAAVLFQLTPEELHDFLLVIAKNITILVVIQLILSQGVLDVASR